MSTSNLVGLGAIFRREFKAYFATPLALIFIVIFLGLTGIFTFYIGQFYERAQADLDPFFAYHPWLYLFLIPALAMRLWAEERKSGTVELLLTFPVPVWITVLGKYLAAWAFTGLALALTFPVWITVNYLGDPDNGVIVAGYVASFLMAGAYLAIGAACSALTRNQVIAFVLGVTICFLFTVSGLPIVLDFFQGWAPGFVVDTVESFSFLSHFTTIMKGVLDGRSILYFASLIAVWLFANLMIIDLKRESGG